MLQQEQSIAMAVPEELAILVRCPKCKRQTLQVRFRGELEGELANDHLALYCGHCDLTWEGGFAEKGQAQHVLSGKPHETF